MRNLYDLQSLLYLASCPALGIAQWIWGVHWLVYACLLFVLVSVHVVHHNHIHLGIWHNRKLNRLTDLYISVVTSVPSAIMISGHVRNHHVHQHGPEDVTRTYRFGGDHNHLVGYLLHPIQALSVLMPMFWRDFLAGLPGRSRFSRNLLLETSLIAATCLTLAIIDWRKFLLLVVLPQLFGLHWLLASNYFQHAHCDDESKVNYARNFTGAFVNLAWLNIGFHTAHHDNPTAHWSTLRAIHQQERLNQDPRLCCSNFAVYFLKTFFLSSIISSYRSQSLRAERPLAG